MVVGGVGSTDVERRGSECSCTSGLSLCLTLKGLVPPQADQEPFRVVRGSVRSELKNLDSPAEMNSDSFEPLRSLMFRLFLRFMKCLSLSPAV